MDATIPVSSASSRLAASSKFSPGSRPPPGGAPSFLAGERACREAKSEQQGATVRVEQDEFRGLPAAHQSLHP
jgi:hypothetical protein